MIRSLEPSRNPRVFGCSSCRVSSFGHASFQNQTLLVSACEDLEDALGVPLARVKQGVVAAMHDHDALAEEIARITSSLAEQSLTLMEAATRLLGVLQWLPPQLSSKLPSVEAVGAWVEPVEELLRMELATLGLPEQRPSLLVQTQGLKKA